MRLMRDRVLMPPRRAHTPPACYLLNADTVRLIFLRHEAVLRKLTGMPLLDLALSSVVAAQVHHACAREMAARRLERAAELLMRAVEVHSWDYRAARSYGALCRVLERNHVQLDLPQRLVAAHALSLNAVLVTQDPAFLRVPGLPQEDWSRCNPVGVTPRHVGGLSAAVRSCARSPASCCAALCRRQVGDRCCSAQGADSTV